MLSIELYRHTSPFPFDQNPKHPWTVFPGLKPLPTCGLCSWCGLVPQASLCHSFHVPLPITFTPILLLTSIPGPASRSVQLRDEPQACMTATAQHREHIQMNFYRQVQLISDRGTEFSDLWFPLWCPAPTQSPLSPTHPGEGSSQIWLLCTQAAVTCFTQQDTENFSSPLSPFQSRLKLLSPLHQEVGFIWLVCLD